MSRFLLLSHDGAGLPLAARLQDEGHEVVVYIQEKDNRTQYDGLLKKVTDWESALDPETIVVFDSVGFGLADDEKPNTDAEWEAYTSIGDELRQEGYRVVGGSSIADRMELDRTWGAKLAKEAGLIVPHATAFEDFKKAIEFVRQTKKRYILKPHGNQATFDLYPAESWEDMVDYLQDMIQQGQEGESELQEFIEGQQLSCEGWWTGTKFVSLNHTFEHKPQMPQDLGPFTGETGSLIYWTPSGETDKQAEETVLRLTDTLTRLDFPPGPLDVNCIVNERGSHFLEFTARFGYPALYAQMASVEDKWGEVLESLAEGTFTGFHPKPFNWTLCARVWIPKWPFGEVEEKLIHRAMFSRVKPEMLDRIVFLDVIQNGVLRVAGADGELMTVTELGDSIAEVRGRLYKLLDDLYLYPMAWRTDLGITALDQLKALKRWEYAIPAEL